MKPHIQIRLIDATLRGCKIILVILAICFAATLIAALASCSSTKTTAKTHSEAQTSEQLDRQQRRQTEAGQSIAEVRATKQEQAQNFIVEFERWQFDDSPGQEVATPESIPEPRPKSRDPAKPPNVYTKGRIIFNGTQSEATDERSNTDNAVTITEATDTHTDRQSQQAQQQEQTKQPANLWRKALFLATLFATLFVLCFLYWKRTKRR